MAILFSADDIFEIAEQIERNGASFYRQIAGIESMSEVRPLLLDLAEMEECHQRFFSDLRKTLSSQERTQTVFDPDNEAASYLQAFADGYVFKANEKPSECLTKKKEDILRLAIEKEKDTIVFYLGIKNAVPDNLGKSKIDEIIKEEMNHITQLSSKLASP